MNAEASRASFTLVNKAVHQKVCFERSEMTDENDITTGACLCGAVRYEVKGPLRDVVNCHCSMCQRLHGNFGPHSKARKENITITVPSPGLSGTFTSSTTPVDLSFPAAGLFFIEARATFTVP
jgi:hypothetical protein